MTEQEVQKAKDYLWETISNGERESLITYATSEFLTERRMKLSVSLKLNTDYSKNSNEEIAEAVLWRWQPIIMGDVWSKIFKCAIREVEQRIQEIDSVANFTDREYTWRKQLSETLEILKTRLGNQEKAQVGSLLV